MAVNSPPTYGGRIAPSPTGLLHLGHARTFWIAAERCRRAGGVLTLRNDDLDRDRCRPEFVAAFQRDLGWLGITWAGPMITQSERLPRYRAALRRLHAANLIYPCDRSRREVAAAASAPHEGEAADDEPIFPRKWRPAAGTTLPPLSGDDVALATNWRFRVPDGETVTFDDGLAGRQSAVAGRDFGDFLVWRKDDVPSYQLACAVDDGEGRITEVVRGADLIRSTFRQLLLLRALGYPQPHYVHCPLMRDEQGRRLAKRYDALSVAALRDCGKTAAELVAGFRDAKGLGL